VKNRSLPTRVLRSLRSRILLLALLVCVLLAAALSGFYLLLRQTQSALIEDSGSRLAVAVNTFAADALNALPTTANGAIAPLNSPPTPEADAILSPITANALRHEPGVEGGFYSSRTQDLSGYAFPTSEGPGPKQDIPPRERPTILSVAQQATQTGKPASFVFRGQEDVILFQAAPLMRKGRTFGCVWAMHRIHNANSARDMQALIGMSGLALAAMACVGIAFWITRNVQADVSTIQGRLEDLERDLSEPSRGEVRATELETILHGIDRLGASLRLKIAEERKLVDQLHHKERLAALGQVAAGVAHELRNPLATIRLRAQMYVRTKDAEQLNRSSMLILGEIDRLSAVLDRLLYFAKPIQLQLQGFEPDMLCGEIVSALQPEAERSGVELSHRECPCGAITGDKLKLRQVLENLIRNSVESFDGMESAPRKIVVTTVSANDHVVLAVEDNGTGLKEDARSRAFDPFFTTKAHGTGLGLSIAREIARAHRGTLELKPIPSGGTLAKLTLPRTPDGKISDGGTE